ncbi:MAG: GGDEF domain-containing protein [Pseudomonadota bacterium]|nr:MAG: GGDEF domain-containing protein [Pseudomonadota bacterium]
MSDEKHQQPTLDLQATEHVMRLLEPLNTTASGSVLYKQVRSTLRESAYAQSKITRGYAALVHTLLAIYRKQLPKSSLLNLELKLVQQRLAPPITLVELGVLQGYIVNVGRLMSQVVDPDVELVREALAPLLGDSEAPPQIEQMHGADRQPPQVPERSEQHDVFDAPLPPSVELQVSSIYRHRLDQHQHEFQQLQSNLANRVYETARQQEKFGTLLELVHKELSKAEAQEDLDRLRSNTIGEIEKLLSGQGVLTNMLNDTQAFLHLVKKNSDKLSSELDQVRVLSLTDELTQLPNRRAFLRRIEDEINRAQRYNAPLTIAIIDLDRFKQINDNYGHSVGDEILRMYAQDILSVFRRYDMVARYGGEEFAVLLPNTDKDGTMRALQKVRNKALDTSHVVGTVKISMPTFSAGVALYDPGESAGSLIERADAMLYLAKQRGRDRVEMDTTTRIGNQAAVQGDE